MHIISMSITSCICPFTQFETQNHAIKKHATLITYLKGCKYSPEKLFTRRKTFYIHILASIGNARQFIQYIKSFLSTKFLFLKISFFQNFVSFCFILFYLKKIEIHCSQLTVDCYCSQLTVDRTIHSYCSPLLFTVTVGHNTIIVLQYNSQQPCSLASCNTIPHIAIQFSSLPHAAIHFQPLHPLAIHFGVLQYNCSAFKPSYCNTNQATYTHKLQYNPCIAIQFPLHIQVAIQIFFFFLLQYTSHCNTNHSTNDFLVTIHFPLSQYNLGSSPSKFLHHIFFFVFH